MGAPATPARCCKARPAVKKKPQKNTRRPRRRRRRRRIGAVKVKKKEAKTKKAQVRKEEEGRSAFIDFLFKIFFSAFLRAVWG